MKNYKMVNFDGFEDKCKMLDLKIEIEEDSLKFPFAYIYEGKVSLGDTLHYYNNEKLDYQEITQADFLALPEPIKVGDWVKLDNNCDEIFISRVRVITGNGCFVKFNKAEWYHNEITKLTQKQIEVLEL